LYAAGAKIGRIASRNVENARKLADAVGAEAVEISRIDGADADIVIIAVHDDAISTIVNAVTPAGHAIFTHTAGSVPMSVFDPGRFPRHGIFYPMQTMSKTLDVDWRTAPMFIEGSSPEVENELMAAARLLSDNVSRLDSDHRAQLHAAAVICCNMAMYLWSQADSVLSDAGLDFEVMRPLLEVTLDRTRSLRPAEAMTGPARRGDLRTIRRHLASLPPEVEPTYRILSEAILAKYHPELSL
ncbi:MAG: DUF2520 domain-containing protein, partial [Muribaculaceae bacterium]|nr:DUF2520 domain-containing protein [Muribaculaceae bacterium]